MTDSSVPEPAEEPPGASEDLPDGDADDDASDNRWLSAARLGPIALIGTMVAAGIVAAIMVTPGPDEEALARPEEGDVVVAGGAPLSWDPAVISDGVSAQMLAQVYEGLTELDTQTGVRPALAESWDVEDDGRRIVFQLRPGATFSDGSAMTADDVRRSWLRVLDPAHPSPLSSLLDDIEGAAAYTSGEGRAEDVGISADGGTLTVDFMRPASYFPAVAAVPTLAVVPTSIDRQRRGPNGVTDFTASGPYVPIEQGGGEVQLEVNASYWGNPPSMERIAVITDDGGRSSVDVFEDEALDWTRISASDASWIRYDRRLGPQLRRTEDMAVEFLAFDTTQPPFDNVALRRAIAMAVDWRGLARINGFGGEAATSLIPPGIPARSEDDFLLPYDPEQARAELAATGYTDGAGQAPITLTTYGIGETSAIAAEIENELGIEVVVERRPFEEHSALLDLDTPASWTLSWSADYPHAHDFLGLLLRTGSSANEGAWSNASFDALIDAAAATEDPLEQERLYSEAQAIVRDEVPLIPLGYAETWALSREGLRGGDVAGTGILRYSDLEWDR